MLGSLQAISETIFSAGTTGQLPVVPVHVGRYVLMWLVGWCALLRRKIDPGIFGAVRADVAPFTPAVLRCL
jgi:hypothetical protein